MAIIGSHAIIYSKDASADRAFMRDILKLTHIDAGGGWLIFGLPPSEIAIHPHSKNKGHEIYLLCDDVEAFVSEMGKKKISCSKIQDAGWGLLTQLTLPGGGKIGVYEPRHPRPKVAVKSKKKAAKKHFSK